MRQPLPVAGSMLRASFSVRLLGVGLVGTVGTLGRPADRSALLQEADPGPPTRHRAIPVLARPVPAYTRLTRDHFWDAQKGLSRLSPQSPRSARRP